jgi:hypothetical protein
MYEGASLLTTVLAMKVPGPPDGKGSHSSSRSAAPMQLWARGRLREVTQTVEWRQGQTCSKAGKIEAACKAAELGAYADTLPILVPLPACQREAPDATG